MWTFYDYIDGTTNHITVWLNGLPVEVAADLDARLDVMRVMPPPWGRPYSAPLKGKPWAGLRELRFKSNNVHYRVAYRFGPPPMSVTLLYGFDKSTRVDSALAKRVQQRGVLAADVQHRRTHGT